MLVRNFFVDNGDSVSSHDKTVETGQNCERFEERVQNKNCLEEIESEETNDSVEQDSRLVDYLMENGRCHSTEECLQFIRESEDEFYEESSKRDYCCIVEYKSDFTDQTWNKCRAYREFRNEIGRLTAQFKCKGLSIGWTSGDSDNSGWSVGTEFSREVRSAHCRDVEDCNNGGETPWPINPPECREGEVIVGERKECKVSGYWVENKVCASGKWETRIADFGCINQSGGAIE